MKRFVITWMLGLAALAPIAAVDRYQDAAGDSGLRSMSQVLEARGKFAQENAEELAKLPERLRPAVHRATVFDARITAIDKVTRDGRTHYQVAFTSDVRSWKAKYTEDGILIETDSKPDDWNDVPPAVRAALLQHVKAMGPDAGIPLVWREMLNDAIVWRALVEKDDQARFVLVGEDGKAIDLRKQLTEQVDTQR